MPEQREKHARPATDDRYRAIFEGNPAAILVLDAESGAITDANEAAVHFYGLSLQQLRSLTAFDLNTLPEHVTRELLCRARKGLQRIFELPHRLSDGSIHEVRCNLSSFMQDGRQLLFCIMHDVSGHRQAETDARVRSAALRAVPHGVMIMNRSGIIEWVNPGLTDMTGWEAHELVGRSPDVLHSGSPDSAGCGPFWNAIRSGRAWRGETVNRRRDGSLYPEEQTLTPVADPDGTVRHFVAVKQDVTERAADRQRLQGRARKQQALAELGHAALRNRDARELARKASTVIAEVLGADYVSVLRLDPDRTAFTFWTGSGWPEGTLADFRVPNDAAGHAGYTLLSEKPLISNDLSEETRFAPAPILLENGVRSSISMPVDHSEEAYGLLAVHFTSQRFLSDGDIAFLQGTANTLAAAIRQNRYRKRISESNSRLLAAYDSTIEGLARALDLRDHETEGHSRRVMDLSVALARKLGMAGARLTALRRGALLHDIGKMGIPDAILHKPGPLTPAEREYMQKHTTLARDLLTGISFLEDAVDIPFSHHEKWDGSGYPLGLAGEAIPLPARIFAVVDVYDALTSNRPYRPAWPVTDALDHIRNEAGRHFDPGVVSAFLELMRGQDCT